MQGFLKIRDRLRVLKCNGADGTPSLHSGGRGTVGSGAVKLDVCGDDDHSSLIG